MRPLPTLFAAATLAASASLAGAQTPRATLKITARDSTGAPVPQAELTVTRGLKDVVARGTTDENGEGVLSVELKDSTDFNVTMRKVGYTRGDRFVSTGPRDTSAVAITVGHIQNQLAAVKVTAHRGDPRFTSYHLDADEIEASNEPMENAFDVVKRLRPVMLTSRGGCGTGIRNVWVNGKRIRLPLPPTRVDAQEARVGTPIDARYSYVAVSVLQTIAPEHIEQLDYHDCFDTSMAAVGNNNALFITLKPGVAYQENVGSFVDDVPAKKAASK